LKRPGSLPKRPKYGNRHVEINGQHFDSQAEAARWIELTRLQQRGKISDLRRQVSFELVPSVRLFGSKRATPALRYVADFGYTLTASGKTVIEDTKGVLTRVYKIKRHIMKALYNIDILET
jgi:hypothetical protein